MTITIGEAEVNLPKTEIAIAKSLISKLLSSLKSIGGKGGLPTLYLTGVVFMYVKSVSILSCLPPEDIDKLINLATPKQKEEALDISD